jgi:hypothetical protein
MRWLSETVGLLRLSEKLYGRFGLKPPRLETIPIQNIFQVGGQWMKKALKRMGVESLSRFKPPFQELGYFKYGLAAWAALLAGCLLLQAGPWAASTAALLVFYLVESQMVFLFPLSIEAVEDPIRESLRDVRRAGGNFKVMVTVMVLALYMVSGGFFRENLKKSWCIGCLAVLVWHLRLRRKKALHGLS